MNSNATIHVNSELGTLKRLLVHSPDGGIGKVVPGKFKEWLYDDTVHISQMRREYNEYVKLLLYFLDPEKIPYITEFEKKQAHKKQPDCYKPHHPDYFNSDKVIDTQYLLAQVLKNETIKQRIVSAVCAWEGCSFATERMLDAIQDPYELAKVLISGVLHIADNNANDFVFAPLPNFIFTRDISIVINDHILLSNAATPARERESMLMKYITYYHLYKNNPEKVIEISESSDFFLLEQSEQQVFKTSVEGGDVMMIAPNHLLIGCSERTTPSAVDEIIHKIFANNQTGIEKISVVKIPKQRAMMHIDTVFTQVRKNTWVLFGRFSEKVMQQKNATQYAYYLHLMEKEDMPDLENIEVLRFYKPLQQAYHPGTNYQLDIRDKIQGLESLLHNISIEDYGVAPEDVTIIYSGNNVFPYDEREQWTDSCNLLALKEGVVVGYDRNDETMKAFQAAGFNVIKVTDLLQKFQNKELTPAQVQNTLIVLPSAELSRARGGAHCMSMPLLRENI
ncbi:arginine deiminase family protein [Limnovirga soli]|uniref:arginine deiminase n=1 Tax=Limnovirga soli TaxID=2656915 RepID=A0A8J8FMP9_9BACT|nr:arginine deiminase family protein [Limnovirga soli]NNV57699.1 amidinotransferase [Limnovirga soli]